MKQLSDKEYWQRLRDHLCLRCGEPLSESMRQMTATLFDVQIHPIRCDGCAAQLQAEGESARDSYFTM